MKVSAPRVVAFFALLLGLLTVLLAGNGGSAFELGLWCFAVGVVVAFSFAVALANHRAPVHRGSYAVATSASPSLAAAVALGLAALAGAYGLWFAVMVPAPLALASYLAARDHHLKKRLLDDGTIDPGAPPRLAGPARPARDDHLDGSAPGSLGK